MYKSIFVTKEWNSEDRHQAILEGMMKDGFTISEDHLGRCFTIFTKLVPESLFWLTKIL